jgi:hypothetical protein
MRILRKLLVGNTSLKMDVMSFPASPEAIELQEKLQRGMLAALSGESELHVRMTESEKAKR